jgi:hypothetical protein
MLPTSIAPVSNQYADQRAVARTSILGLEHIEIKPYPVDTYSKLFEINLFVNNAKN